MDDDHIGVVGEDFHHIASLGPLARLEWVGLVLYSHSVPNREGREGLGSSEELLLHLCMAFGKGLLPQVSLQSPLHPGLVLGEHSRDVVPQLPAEQDHGRTKASHGVRSVAVEQQSPGKPVGVQLSLRPKVLHDQPLG